MSYNNTLHREVFLITTAELKDNWEHFYPRIYSYINAHVDSNHTEDITQNVAAAVCAKYKSMKSGDPDAFLKWLYNAAKIEIKLFYRKQQRSIKTFHGDYDMVDYSMDDLLDAIGKPSTIKVLYSKLNQNERELFRLRIIGHNTYAQLADILGKTEGSLMTAVSRLLKKCQKIIQEHENLL